MNEYTINPGKSSFFFFIFVAQLRRGSSSLVTGAFISLNLIWQSKTRNF